MTGGWRAIPFVEFFNLCLWSPCSWFPLFFSSQTLVTLELNWPPQSHSTALSPPVACCVSRVYLCRLFLFFHSCFPRQE